MGVPQLWADTRVVHQSFFWIIEAMVWQADDKQVFPLRKSLELIDKFPQAIISKGKGIGNLFFQTMIRKTLSAYTCNAFTSCSYA